MDWNLLGFIKASQYRKRIILILDKGNKTPKEISDFSEYPISHVSQTLKILREREIVICLTPELRKGKIYSLTELGKSMARELEK